MAGVPKAITDWMDRRYAVRMTQLVFDDFISEPFAPPGGLDQGDAFAVVQYLFYNSGLLKVIKTKAEELGLLFMDDAILMAWATSFWEMHMKLESLMNNPGGVLDWAKSHNCSFGIDKFQLADYTCKREPHPTKPKKTIPLRGDPIRVGGKEIPRKENIKLLGVVLNSELRFREQGAIAIAKGQTWLSQFRKLARTTGGVAAEHVQEWYILMLMSSMLYAADVYLTPQCHPGNSSNDRSVRKKPQWAIVSKLTLIQ